METNPLAFIKDLFSKIIDAAAKLPALLLFTILMAMTLIVGLIGMALLKIDLQNNVLWLLGILVIGALFGFIFLEYIKTIKAGIDKEADRAQVGSRVESAPSDATQHVIYDSTKSSSIGFDFRGRPSPLYQGKGKDAKPITETGRGELTFEDGGVLNVTRENIDGRFEIRLLRYSYRGADRDYLPRNELIGGDRKLELQFDAKVSKGARHTLKAVLKNEETEKWLASTQAIVKDNQWTEIKLYLRADPSLTAHLRIDDMDVSTAPSSVQLRKIRFVEQVE